MDELTTTTTGTAISEVGIVLAIDGQEPATYQEALDHCATWNLFDKEVRKRLLYKVLIQGAKEGVSRSQIEKDLPVGFCSHGTFINWISAAPEELQDQFPVKDARGGTRPSLVKSDQNSEEAEAEQIQNLKMFAAPAEADPPASLAEPTNQPSSTSNDYLHLNALVAELQSAIGRGRQARSCSPAEISAIIQGLFICHGDAELWEKDELEDYAADRLDPETITVTAREV